MLDFWRPRYTNCGGVTQSPGEDCAACRREEAESQFAPMPERIERMKAEIRAKWARPDHGGAHGGGEPEPFTPRVVATREIGPGVRDRLGVA